MKKDQDMFDYLDNASEMSLGGGSGNPAVALEDDMDLQNSGSGFKPLAFRM